MDFGPIQNNETLIADASIVEHVTKNYSAEEVAILLGALGAMVASIIYAFKNIKHSSCCLGICSCDQRTEIPASKQSIELEMESGLHNVSNV